MLRSLIFVASASQLSISKYGLPEGIACSVGSVESPLHQVTAVRSVVGMTTASRRCSNFASRSPMLCPCWTPSCFVRPRGRRRRSTEMHGMLLLAQFAQGLPLSHLIFRRAQVWQVRRTFAIEDIWPVEWLTGVEDLENEGCSYEKIQAG